MYQNKEVPEKNKTVLLPTQQRTLATLGENIRYARLCRDLSAEQVAERTGIGRSTLVKVEKGDGGVANGTYLKVLFTLGRRLQDTKLTTQERASKKSKTNT